MDEFLRRSPKWLVVGGALALALLLMLVFDPPYTACDSQFEVFKNSQTPFLYLDPDRKFMTETEFQKNLKTCEERNLPGACFSLFENLRLFVKSLDTVGAECSQVIAQKSEVQNALFEAIGFIARLAWGPEAPKSYLDKTGWLDSVHLSIYCDLQRKILDYYPQEKWATYREEALGKLPLAEGLDRKELWNRSLFSLKCP